ncbi:hypothetical protein HNV12_02020 [Methanococcoides sp. SA1]|nr:hypothetical protein [Methanococcoides sp. SA1]
MVDRVYFATTNKGKVQSLERGLEKYGISVVQEPIDLIEPRSSDVREIARAKIEQAYSEIGKPTAVIDAGFYIDSLNGFPRAFVNFVLNDTIGLDGILTLTKDKPRACDFRLCLAYMDESLSEPKYFVSKVKGNVADEKRGVMQDHLWSRLGLIFVPEGMDRTLAELSYEEYVAWKDTSDKGSSLGGMLGEWISSRGNSS